jgi:energy-coupling factor transporter transmembrane protein EcfT
MTPSPRVRLTASLLAVVATFVADDVRLLSVLLLLVFLPLTHYLTIRKNYVRFLVVFVVPLALGLLLVWGGLVGAPPGEKIYSNWIGGVEYGLLIALRVAVVGGVFELAFNTVRPSDLPGVLRGMGVNGDWLVIVMGSFALLPELMRRADQIMTARLARGSLASSSISTRLAQLPFILKPLFVWVIRSAIQRAESWEQKQLLSRVSVLGNEANYSAMGNIVWLSLASALVAVAFSLRFLGDV